MESKEETYRRAQERLTDYMEARQMRKTPERYEVLRIVCQMENIFTIEQLTDQMQQKAAFCVSRSTLFNTLEILVDAKLVIKHTLVRAAHYESNVEQQPRVCMVCEDCGLVKRLGKPDVLKFLASIKSRGFSVHQPVLYLHGLCPKCTRARKKRGLL